MELEASSVQPRCHQPSPSLVVSGPGTKPRALRFARCANRDLATCTIDLIQWRDQAAVAKRDDHGNHSYRRDQPVQDRLLAILIRGIVHARRLLHVRS